MFLSADQTSDCIGARTLLCSIPQTGALLADRGYDADWFRNALIEMEILPCSPPRKGRKVPIPQDADRYRLSHKIENMFARLKDWRRNATRQDRCPILFLSVCALAATVIFWLCSSDSSPATTDGMRARMPEKEHYAANAALNQRNRPPETRLMPAKAIRPPPRRSRTP